MKIIINGVELEGNFMDADFLEPYEQAANEIGQKAAENANKPVSSLAESVREQCRTIDSYFDGIFGEGTSDKVFEGAKNDLMIHLEAVESLTKWANGEKKRLNDFVNKYTQRQNAAMNRQKAEKTRQFISGKKR